MHITLNGKVFDFSGSTLSELRKMCGFSSTDDVSVVNGFQTSEDIPLHEGDSAFLLKKGVMPPKDELEALMCARHTPHVYEKFRNACVGIAGCGGLGSNIAVMLARSGVGRLIIADFDVVEPTNLNRQMYMIRHLGMLKAEALKSLTAEINPYISVEAHCVRIDADNAMEIFGDCDVVCEAFDDPENKAVLVNTLLSESSTVKVVAASGLAGLSSCNNITTRMVGNRLAVCGDGVSAAENGVGLMAPRAAVCAGHQANAALNFILGNNTEQERN